MNSVTLKAKRRETGKQASKNYRRQGLVTGVYYLKGEESIPFVVEPLDLRSIVFTSQTKIVELEIEGEEMKECVLKEVEFDPITDQITHFDLIGIVRGQLFTVDVPIILTGSAIGAKEGGLIQHSMHKVRIHVMPRHMPSSVEVDISDLKIGDSLFIRDLNVENVTFDASDDTVVVSCVPPRVSKEGVAIEAELEEEEAEEVEEEAAE
jgi:large subunit ribosomal protein L25